MTRRQLTLTLALAAAVISHTVAGSTVASAANRGNQFASFVVPGHKQSSQKNKQLSKKQSSNRRGNNSANLPQTNSLDSELRNTEQQLNALASQISRIEKSVETSRKRAEEVAKMVRTLRRLDDKVGRIKRQLDTAARIPQLRVVKPLANSLGKVRDQIHKLRKKADKVHRDSIKPLISRLKKTERKLEAKVKEVRGVASQTRQARQQLSQLRSYVASGGNQFGQVRALESLARPVRNTIQPMNQSISQLSRSLGDADRQFNTLNRHLSAVSKVNRSLSKLDKDLAKADKAARDLDKVLSKKISIKFPKKFSISIRQLLEAPGKVIDIVLKPLEKLARKALDPVLKKFQIKIKMPSDINSLDSKLNQLSSAVKGVGSKIDKIERDLNKKLPRNFQQQLSKLMSTSTGSLGR